MKIYGNTAPQGPLERVGGAGRAAAARPGPSFRDAHAALAFTAAEDDESFGKLVDGLQAMADGGTPPPGRPRCRWSRASAPSVAASTPRRCA